MDDSTQRQTLITNTLVDAFESLMEADPQGFRTKFRKMAANPFAFYRGSACLFYADMEAMEDQWADERTSRIWIHGDLHAENFGAYMSSTGALTFDINDFDEAYVGHFSWDLRRFVTSLALLGWQKALPMHAVRALARTFLTSYLDQVDAYHDDADSDFALRLDNTTGTIHRALQHARSQRRTDLLGSMTLIDNDNERHFREDRKTRRLDDAEYGKVLAAFEQYLETIPEAKKSGRDVFYNVKDLVGKKGFGIGSAGLPAYNVLIEGFNQAQENDIVLAMKQGNIAAPSRVVTDERVSDYFRHDGHRTVVSQRSLQANTDRFVGYTTIDGVGFVVSELSPYNEDLDWDNLTEPDQIEPVLKDLGRATAKIHCTSDADSDHDLVPFQTEEAIRAVIDGRREEFIDDIIDFSIGYARRCRQDHALFVDAFREDKIAGVPAV